MLKNNLFYCKNKDIYPPFKCGMYMEEYFLDKYKNNIDNISTKRLYIPVLWTNFQINSIFKYNKRIMQNDLNKWIIEHPSSNGYFTIVQYDDGPLLELPKNIIIYGACSGHIPLPLIYQDTNNTLLNMNKKSYNEKKILCSFVGTITSNNVIPNVRQTLFNLFLNNNNFTLINSGNWTPAVNVINQNKFIELTINSKFALAPRGYGRNSFRFFECFLLGTIPIYIWNDVDWLPFKDIIDYSKLCIVMNINDIHNLERKLLSITEDEYNNMFQYYQTIKHLFTLEGMYEQIIKYENI